MAARDFSTPIGDIGDAINRLYRIAAVAQGTAALLGESGTGHTEQIQSAIFMNERIQDDLKRLANDLDVFDIRDGKDPIGEWLIEHHPDIAKDLIARGPSVARQAITMAMDRRIARNEDKP